MAKTTTTIYFYMVWAIIVTTSLPLPRDTSISAPDDTRLGPLGEQGSLIEGDIIPFPQVTGSKRTKRGRNDIIDPINSEGTLWPNNTVYYKFDTMDETYLNTFINAMRAIEAKTCITFVPGGSETVAYLNLTTRHNECCSYVGMVGTVQDVSIGPGCSKVGNAIHELGHALGLYHEHTRSDRDDYITVNLENMEKIHESNFNINPNYQQEIINEVDYDLGSVMHYGYRYFSRNGENTIDINPDVYVPECISFGQRNGLSHRDALKLNALYPCHKDLGEDPCPVTPPTPSPTTPTTELPSESPTPIPCNKYFESGDEVFLKFGRNTDTVIQCNPNQRLGCYKSECTIDSGCRDTRYRIHLAEDRGNKILKSGDEVVLEIVDSRSSRYAMSCSRINESCLMETCPQNPPTNSPILFPSTQFCDSQKMRIYGYNKNGNQARRILDYHDIVFRAVDNSDQFLNCFDRSCKFYTHGTCDEDDDLSFSGQSSTTCVPQQFQLHHTCSL